MQKRACKAASASSELQLRHLCHLSQLLPFATSKGIAIATLHMLLRETGCLGGQATPSLWPPPPPRSPLPSSLPTATATEQEGGKQGPWVGDVLHYFPSPGCKHRSQVRSPTSSPRFPSRRLFLGVPRGAWGGGATLQADGSCSIPAFSCFAILWGHDGILPA